MLTTLHRRSPDLNGASPSSPIDPNDDLVHFCHVAALVMILYDHLITLDNEVEYIWSKKWSKSKILYLLARYFGDVLLTSVCVGAIGLKFVGTGSMITIIITQLIMQSRVKALYGPLVSTLLTTFWVMEVIAVISLGVASLAAIDVHPVILDSTRMCNPTYLPRYAFLFWVPVIVFESVLFGLALRIAYQNYREIGTWRGVSLLYVILRDNFSFFICAFAAYIITATTWLTANPRYFTVPGSFSCSLTTIMGCRLILNLCEAYHHPPGPDETAAARQHQGARPNSIWAVATSGGNIFFGRPGPSSGTGASRSARGTAHSWGAGAGGVMRSALASVGTSTGKTVSSVGVLSSESEVTEAEAEAGAGEDVTYEMSLVGQRGRGGVDEEEGRTTQKSANLEGIPATSTGG